MSDAMTNVKIEDVLSSIRRLVAEGSGDAAAAPDGRTPSEGKRVGRLVLMPSHRVDLDPEQGPPEVEPPLQLRPSDRRDAPATSSASDLLATIAELEAAVRGQADDWEDDGTGTDLDKSWASAGFRGDVSIEDAVEVAPSDWPNTLAEAQRIFGTQETRDDREDAAEPVFRHQEAHGAAARRAEEDEHHDDLMPLSDEDFDAAEREQLNYYLEGGGGITREALAQVVRDIVREELQGRMGERVTRNVRKLVRREIHRALSTSDFD
ncbi:hypothetical protein EU805_10300 [Salipiger sp. IMCC34102]|uniref:hypothetical protein n=1 Tax=Salipiger sp. IMCC34102 TaxID=2510647 RepID=UPI00101CBC24|nr:hypothetical protein [Salipiger sp. IMCC34102]RYH02233.1 hypothetical protein EU805_10300 [Salipiger sp. IMCC34102]